MAITGGPVSADGYTWYEVSRPIHEWGPVVIRREGRLGTRKLLDAGRIAPRRAPNATTVDAGIAGMGFGGESALTGESTAALDARSFSPDGGRLGGPARASAGRTGSPSTA